jgi:hypothetical protein
VRLLYVFIGAMGAFKRRSQNICQSFNVASETQALKKGETQLHQRFAA